MDYPRNHSLYGLGLPGYININPSFESRDSTIKKVLVHQVGGDYSSSISIRFVSRFWEHQSEQQNIHQGTRKHILPWEFAGKKSSKVPGAKGRCDRSQEGIHLVFWFLESFPVSKSNSLKSTLLSHTFVSSQSSRKNYDVRPDTRQAGFCGPSIHQQEEYSTKHLGVSKNRGTTKMEGLQWKTLLKWMIWSPLFLETPICCSCLNQGANCDLPIVAAQQHVEHLQANLHHESENINGALSNAKKKNGTEKHLKQHLIGWETTWDTSRSLLSTWFPLGGMKYWLHLPLWGSFFFWITSMCFFNKNTEEWMLKNAKKWSPKPNPLWVEKNDPKAVVLHVSLKKKTGKRMATWSTNVWEKKKRSLNSDWGSTPIFFVPNRPLFLPFNFFPYS